MKKKRLSIYFVLILLITVYSCTKENEPSVEDVQIELRTNVEGSNSFSNEISAKDFFVMAIKSAKGELQGFSYFGALNETEWYITDDTGNTQYYVADVNTQMLYAVESFSGQIEVPVEPNDDAIVICSFSGSSGDHCCTSSVDAGVVWSTLTTDCGGTSVSTDFPTGFALAACAGAYVASGPPCSG